MPVALSDERMEDRVKTLLTLAVVGALGAGGWQVAHPAHATVAQTAPQAAPPAVPATTAAGVPVYAADVVARFPHDSGAFTEGLLFCGGALYESTGKEGASDVRRVNLADGKVVARG